MQHSLILRLLGPIGFCRLVFLMTSCQAVQNAPSVNQDLSRSSVPSASSAEVSPKVIALIEKLKKPAVDDRRSAVCYLGTLSSSAQAASPDLIPLLKDPNPKLRGSVVRTLRSVNLSEEKTISQVLPLISDSDVGVRIAVIETLGSLGKAGETTIPKIIPFLKDSNSLVRSAAAGALANMGAYLKPFAKELIPQLMSLLKDPYPAFVVVQH